MKASELEAAWQNLFQVGCGWLDCDAERRLQEACGRSSFFSTEFLEADFFQKTIP